MNKKNKWIFLVVILAIVGFWAVKKNTRKTEIAQKVETSKSEKQTYWTCPMHPQIHSDHPGECPICHMKLVQVTTEKSPETTQGGKRSAVEIAVTQAELLGVHKQKVEKMNLTVKLPISGRFISSSSVAFQIYENDLRSVRVGLTFKGYASSSGEEISGIITAVDSLADPSSRTVRVVGTIRKGPKNLFSEASFSGEIIMEIKDALAVPESAVLHTGTSDLVYLFQNENRLTAKKVKLGMKSEGFYQILDGVSEGDLISSGPNFLIDSEAKIRGAND